MLWFHGGALQSGSISQFDGSSLAANGDVIVVTAQYRLGVFGFPGNVSGLPADELNPGFRDQKAALQWIQDNIASFGGDKTRVTIFGESAGAVSVDSQLLSEVDKPLFHAAILQSGGLHTFNRVALGVGVYVTGLGTGNKQDETPFTTLARALNCVTGSALNLTCVKSQTAAKIKSAVQSVNLLFPPVDDNGQSSVGDSDAARRSGRTAKVPVLIGSTFQEGIILPQSAITARSLAQWAQLIYPSNTTLQNAITRAYAVGTSWQIQNEADASKLLHSDFQFACTTTYDSDMISDLGIRTWTRAKEVITEHGLTLPHTATWRYVFNASLPGGGLAGHGSDVGFVFGSQAQSTTANQQLSYKVQTAWASFAKNPTAGPGWPRYSRSTPLSLADLGGQGARDSITMIDPQVVDSRCSVFSDAYDPNRAKSAS